MALEQQKFEFDQTDLGLVQVQAVQKSNHWWNYQKGWTT